MTAYMPQQPMFYQLIEQEEMLCFTQYEPCIMLAPYVRHYFSMSTKGELDETIKLPVHPDGCCTLVFNRIEQKACYVGVRETLIEYPVSGQLDIFGISFYPGALYSLLGVRVEELGGNMADPAEVSGTDISPLKAEILRTTDTEKCLSATNEFLVKVLNAQERPNDTERMLVDKVVRAEGNISIDSIAVEAGVNPKQLRRMFGKAVGVSPKKFATMMRHQAVIDSCLSSDHPDWTKISQKHGYYDQSHMINEFKAFTGITPFQYLRKIGDRRAVVQSAFEAR